MDWELWDDPTWGIAISKNTFIGDAITLLDIMHWDTLYSSMVDF